MNLVCFRHPQFDGKTSPVLSCKTCCSIFIAAVKAGNKAQQSSNDSQWLEEKRNEVKQAFAEQITRIRIKSRMSLKSLGQHSNSV